MNGLHNKITEVCEETLGYQTKHRQNWLDDNDATIEYMIDKKRVVLMDWQNHGNCHTRKQNINACVPTYSEKNSNIKKQCRRNTGVRRQPQDRDLFTDTIAI